jgi:lipocalin-like protein
MHRRNVLSLSMLTTLGLAMLSGNAFAQQKSLKDQLVGTWNIVSWERTSPDGAKVQAFGANPKGVSYFGADGRFFIFYTRAGLPKLASNDRTKATPEEAKALYEGIIAYHGTYTVDDASKTINMQIENTTFPNQLGRQQKRNIDLVTADELKYSNPTATAGGKIEQAFKRAK